MSDSATPWTIALQAPLSMIFPRQGDLPMPGIKPASPALAGGFFTTESPGKPRVVFREQQNHREVVKTFIPGYICFAGNRVCYRKRFLCVCVCVYATIQLKSLLSSSQTFWFHDPLKFLNFIEQPKKLLFMWLYLLIFTVL